LELSRALVVVVAGVGKTALARAVARGLHGESYEEDGKLFVVDMSNHADSHTVRACGRVCGRGHVGGIFECRLCAGSDFMLLFAR
jgi:ATP-dependent Clp protease ATP-binding subunit ClpA